MMEDGHQKLETQLLQKKLQLMKEWTTAFFNDQHRSVMCYLAGLRLKGIDKFDKNSPNYSFKDIKDIDDILADLKAGKLIQIEEMRPAKGEKKTEFIQIDFNFFNIYQTLTTLILQEVKPRLQEFKKFKSGESKKVCKNCGAEKTESQIAFLGLKCNCTNTNFVTIEPNKKQNIRLEYIRMWLQKRFLNKKKQIDELQKRLTETNLRRKKKEEDKKTNEYEQFLKRQELTAIKPEYLIRTSNIQRMRALNLYGRKQNFRLVNELKNIREMRFKVHLSKEKMDQTIQQ